MARKTSSPICRRANLVRSMMAYACQTSFSPAPRSTVVKVDHLVKDATPASCRETLDRIAGWSP